MPGSSCSREAGPEPRITLLRSFALAEYCAGPERERVNDIVKSNPAVQGKMRGIYQIKPLSANICRVHFVGQGTLGGSVPDFAMKWTIRFSLDTVKNLQTRYMRDGKKVDAELRRMLPGPPKLELLSEEQKEFVAIGKALEVGSDLRRWTSLESPSIDMWMQKKPTGDEKTR
jgi:hypothetical protein